MSTQQSAHQFPKNPAPHIGVRVLLRKVLRRDVERLWETNHAFPHARYFGT
jgi:hypothetical protein